MTGALIQLAAQGIQDLYLTEDPQITFFKVVYRRHTNFSIESIIQFFDSTADFGEGVAATISTKGDLICQTFIFVELPSIPPFMNENGQVDNIRKMAWIRSIGYGLIKEISIEIGNSLVDKQYGEWMYIWAQLNNYQNRGLDKMIGNIPELYDFTNGKPKYRLYIPLTFWFNRHIGLALPIIALSASQVKINVVFRRLSECLIVGPISAIEIEEPMAPFRLGDYIEQTIHGQTIYGYFMAFDYLERKMYYIKIHSSTAIRKNFLAPQNQDPNEPYRIFNSITRIYINPKRGSTEEIVNTELPDVHIENFFLYVNYIFLEQEERNKFVKNNHEYLIEQTQLNLMVGIKYATIIQRLALKHPCKAHYWVAQLDGMNHLHDLFNYTNSFIRYPDGRLYGNNLVGSASLLLNGQVYFQQRIGAYFNYAQPFQYHHRSPEEGINMYSFCLFPVEHQPSGSLNMSFIENPQMRIHLNKNITPEQMASIRSYTINYNVLRICSGMGAVVFV
jgi:hypothetical protein